MSDRTVQIVVAHDETTTRIEMHDARTGGRLELTADDDQRKQLISLLLRPGERATRFRDDTYVVTSRRVDAHA